MTRRIAGCMTGTSLDSIDVALVEIEGEGLAMKPRFVRGVSDPLKSMAKLLRPVAMQKRVTAGQLARYGFMLGMAHMLAIRKVAREDELDLIAVHGQTIYHESRVSWQLFNPWPTVAELGVPVVYDLRWADLASGGDGAPITPVADHVLFRHTRRTQVVVNLGGFANYTWLPATRSRGEAALRSIRGGDICVCNQLLDGIARLTLRKPYDLDGRAAAVGTVDKSAMAHLHTLLRGQAESGRSLGTGDEAAEWARVHRQSLSSADLARTACASIAQTICETIGQADRLILAGGGARNQTLVQELATRFTGETIISDDLGVPLAYREAIGMAILGGMAQDGVPITLPQVTGRSQKVCRAGCWVYP